MFYFMFYNDLEDVLMSEYDEEVEKTVNEIEKKIMTEILISTDLKKLKIFNRLFQRLGFFHEERRIMIIGAIIGIRVNEILKEEKKEEKFLKEKNISELYRKQLNLFNISK